MLTLCPRSDGAVSWGVMRMPEESDSRVWEASGKRIGRSFRCPCGSVDICALPATKNTGERPAGIVWVAGSLGKSLIRAELAELHISRAAPS
jgi:hypothetical protein